MENNPYQEWKRKMKVGGLLLIILSILITLFISFLYKYSFICFDPELCRRAERPLIQLPP